MVEPFTVRVPRSDLDDLVGRVRATRWPEPATTPGWEQGMAWVNGFALGRYSARGPQRTLFVPGPVLRPGRNELVVLELTAATTGTVDLVATPDLG